VCDARLQGRDLVAGDVTTVGSDTGSPGPGVAGTSVAVMSPAAAELIARAAAVQAAIRKQRLASRQASSSASRRGHDHRHGVDSRGVTRDVERQRGADASEQRWWSSVGSVMARGDRGDNGGEFKSTLSTRTPSSASTSMDHVPRSDDVSISGTSVATSAVTVAAAVGAVSFSAGRTRLFDDGAAPAGRVGATTPATPLVTERASASESAAASSPAPSSLVQSSSGGGRSTRNTGDVPAAGASVLLSLSADELDILRHAEEFAAALDDASGTASRLEQLEPGSAVPRRVAGGDAAVPVVSAGATRVGGATADSLPVPALRVTMGGALASTARGDASMSDVHAVGAPLCAVGASVASDLQSPLRRKVRDPHRAAATSIGGSASGGGGSGSVSDGGGSGSVSGVGVSGGGASGVDPPPPPTRRDTLSTRSAAPSLSRVAAVVEHESPQVAEARSTEAGIIETPGRGGGAGAASSGTPQPGRGLSPGLRRLHELRAASGAAGTGTGGSAGDGVGLGIGQRANGGVVSPGSEPAGGDAGSGGVAGGVASRTLVREGARRRDNPGRSDTAPEVSLREPPVLRRVVKGPHSFDMVKGGTVNSSGGRAATAASSAVGGSDSGGDAHIRAVGSSAERRESAASATADASASPAGSISFPRRHSRSVDAGSASLALPATSLPGLRSADGLSHADALRRAAAAARAQAGEHRDDGTASARWTHTSTMMRTTPSVASASRTARPDGVSSSDFAGPGHTGVVDHHDGDPVSDTPTRLSVLLWPHVDQSASRASR
jgi:hypothetical protein